MTKTKKPWDGTSAPCQGKQLYQEESKKQNGVLHEDNGDHPGQCSGD